MVMVVVVTSRYFPVVVVVSSHCSFQYLLFSKFNRKRKSSAHNPFQKFHDRLSEDLVISITGNGERRANCLGHSC